MKIEVRCGGCGKGYLVEESKMPVDGGFVPCQSCGTTIELTADTAARRRAQRRRSPLRRGRAALTSEVCCPRCNLHFVPDGKSGSEDRGAPHAVGRRGHGVLRRDRAWRTRRRATS